MRCFSEGGTKEPMEVEFGETGLARRLGNQYAGLIFRRKKIAAAAKAAKGVVMEQHSHRQNYTTGSGAGVQLKRRPIKRVMECAALQQGQLGIA